MIKITEIKTEHKVNALGVDGSPLISWKYEGGEQTSFRLKVLLSEVYGRGNIVAFDSGEVKTSDNFCRVNGEKLERGKKYEVVLSLNGEKETSGGKSCFQTAITRGDFKGDWVNLPVNSQGGSSLYRLRGRLEKKVILATAYVAGIGYNELYINGEKVGDELLSPATSDYAKRIYYNTYDVTNMLVVGDNVFGVEVAHGWLGAKRMLLQVNVLFDDCTETEFHSAVGSGWWVRGGAVRENSIYDGETYDARYEDETSPHWASPKFEPTWENGWMYTVFADMPAENLKPQNIEPIRVCDEFAPVSFREYNGATIADFGANISGVCEIEVEGERGAEISLYYGERLDERGDVNRLNLRSAKATDKYILKGCGVEKYMPRFTYHGFQYVKIETSGKVKLGKITAKHIHTDTRIVGSFECSDEKLNYLHKIAVRTEHNNEHSILTDCPQRDERFGWLNDLGARLYQTVYNCDMSSFFPKFTADITDTQLSGGEIGDTAPFYTGGRPADPVCVAYLMMPLYCYSLYGDDKPIKTEYNNLKKWTDFLLSEADGGIMTYSYYADWVYPVCFGVKSDNLFVSTLSLYWHLKLMTRISAIAGEKKDSEYYAAKAEYVKNAINAKYYDSEKHSYASGTQTENSMPLTLGVAPEDDKAAIAENVYKDVVSRNYHSTCGNVGYRHLFYVLGEYGYADAAIKILENPEYPGWGYMVANGATSVWERWESEMSNEMDSFDHPMFGSYDAFFYAFMGGIRVDDEAFGCDKITVAPVNPSGITHVNCSFETIRGKIVSNWNKNGDSIDYHVEIPCGITAKFKVGKVEKTLTGGVYDFKI